MKGSPLVDSSDDVGLDDRLRIADVASAIARKQKEVGKQLVFDEVVDDLIQKQIAQAKACGDESMTPEIARKAVEMYFQDLYSFTQPAKNLSYKAAELYVQRKKIFRKVGIPSIVVLCAIGAVYAISSISLKARRLSQKHDVEKAVVAAYQDKDTINNRLISVSSSSLRKSLPTAEENRLSDIIKDVKNTLGGVEGFFDEFCSDGTSEDDISLDNYLAARGKLGNVMSTIGSARTGVEAADAIIKTEDGLQSLKKIVDSLMVQIKSTKPGQSILDKADSLYQSGIACIDNRQLSQAEGYKQELSVLVTSANKYSNLSERLEQLYTSINAVVKDDTAKKQADGLYNQAQQYKQAVDMPKLTKAVTELQGLDAVLNQEYTLFIVDGDRRVPDDNPNKLRYYFIVEARDASGKLVERTISHEERPGTRVNVRKSGVRVAVTGKNDPMPKFYADVGKDRKEDGVIDNNKFALKRKGYLEPEVIFKDENSRKLKIQGEYPY